jgi:hypothetical protein
VIQDACGNTLTPAGPIVGGTFVAGNCTGTITYTYTYTDCAGNSIDWTYTYNIECGGVVMKILLEGAYSTTGDTMTTELNKHNLLPGQNKDSSSLMTVVMNAPYTPFGQPYQHAPWMFTGNLGDTYGDATSPGASGQVTPYPDYVVDWILVSVREDNIQASSEIWKCAGWLNKDGTVSFPDDCGPLTLNPTSTYMVVVEHRNHMMVMDTATNVGGTYLDIDFTQSNTYVPNIFRSGQVELEPGVWAMFSANSEQEFSRISINSIDRTEWRLDQNNLGYYKADHDLNKAADSNDETLWKTNQNRTSGVPN